jgi:hypothetical protein
MHPLARPATPEPTRLAPPPAAPPPAEPSSPSDGPRSAHHTLKLPASAFSASFLEKLRLLGHLHLARQLTANPYALALLLETAGPEALPILGRTLARRVEEALPGLSGDRGAADFRPTRSTRLARSGLRTVPEWGRSTPASRTVRP